MKRSKLLAISSAAAAFALGMAVIGTGFAAGTGTTPQPANKTAAIGNTVDDINANTDHVVLSEQMKVSSPSDLILNLSSECTILTQLVTNNGNKVQDTTGRVEMYVTIDGKRVPVAGDASGNGDNGTVVFCDRTYARSVQDQETPQDGVDQQSDYIRTRTANAFQWLALNTGTAYDNPANGQNVLDIEVHAVYTDTDPTAAQSGCNGDFSHTCSQAFVGKRTLIVEPTHASVIETTATSAGGS
jgi:hypothetical protein